MSDSGIFIAQERIGESMNIVLRKLSEIHPYENNAKKHDKKQINNVAESIKQYGFVQPVVIDRDGVIVIGHCRTLAAKKLGMKEVPCVCVDELTPEQVAALRLVDNKSNESDWDVGLLEVELEDLDLSAFDFEWKLEDEPENENSEKQEQEDRYGDFEQGSLRRIFVQPPLSVLDARNGEWQKRKKIWGKLIDSGNGRDENLLGLNGISGLVGLTGTSIFDPCLCETLIHWFSPKGGRIIDPFAGGSVRGLVSSYMGRTYFGCDLSQKQIKANNENWEALSAENDLFGEELKKPNWHCGDSQMIDEIIDEDEFDCLLTCPPYADLEVYSDDPRDISNMPHEEFLKAYETIIEKSVKKLKDNSFACIVIGEVRNKNGYFINFAQETINAFEKAGAKYYNEIILVTMIGTAALRAKSCFEKSRKVVNTHQKVLVFVKGNAKLAAGEVEPYEFPEQNE